MPQCLSKNLKTNDESTMKRSLDEHRRAELNQLMAYLGVEMKNFALLHQALTHTSYANEARHSGSLHNERLEFLGDAVLDLIISECLFKRFPEIAEGELTKFRANIVCEHTLAIKAAEAKLGHYLLLGKGEALSGGRERISILADTLEAVIGAVYLDLGFATVTKMVLRLLSKEISLVETGDTLKDYKTWLQEVAQRSPENRVVYELVQQTGPDHDKVFTMQVCLNDKPMGVGVGKSKKEAEQKAARAALEELRIISNEHSL